MSFTLNRLDVHGVAQPIAFQSVDHGADATENLSPTLRRHDPMAVAQPIPFGVSEQPDVGHCLRSGASKADKHESTTYVAQPIAFDGYNQTLSHTSQPIDFRNLRYHQSDVSGTMQSKSTGGYSLNYETGIQQNMAVRRLTPVECERLQGFPDNYTNIPWRKADQSPDGPRYKALGNSMAVPVMHWIGRRISVYENIMGNA